MLVDGIRNLPSDALKALAERKHEDLDGPFGCEWWELVRESYEHGERFRACLEPDTTAGGEASYTSSTYLSSRETYLQRFPRENVDVFRRRLRSSTYENHVAPVVDIYHGHLTRREPQRASSLASVSAWWQSADAEGRGVQPFVSEGVRKAQLDGWVACLFDRPRGSGARGSVRTVAQWLEPDEVRDWQVGADGLLDWALLRTERCVRDPVTGDEREIYDCTLWTRQEWARVVLSEEGERYAVELVDGDVHGLGRVPLAVLYWQRPLTRRLYGVSQVNDVVPLNLALFNRRSELTHHLRSAVFALLCVQSDDEKVFQGLKIGTHNGIRYAPEMDAPSFIAPPADVADTLAEECVDLRSAIYVAAKVERPRAESSGDTRSGVARAYDFAATESALLSAVGNLEAFEREAAAIVALWDAAPAADPAAVLASVAEGVRVEYPSSFDAAGLARDLAAALDLLAPDKVGQMLPSARKAARLRVAHAIVPDATPDEAKAIEDEAKTLYDAERAAPDAAAREAGGTIGSTPGSPDDPSGAAPRTFRVGDRVRVADGQAHGDMAGAGVVAKVATSPAYGVKFDGMAGVHEWYVGDELEPEGGRSQNSPAAPHKGM